MEASSLFTKGEGTKSGIFGFDLGTTNSVVTAFSSEGVPTPLKTLSGAITPSCVRFNSDGTHTVGYEAYVDKNKSNVVYSFKKYMGFQNLIEIVVEDTVIKKTAMEVSKIFVQEVMKQVFDLNPQFRGVSRVVVSVPAYFDVHQVNDTRQVFLDLGYTVEAIQQEPTSAALVFQKIKRISDPILVFDLGGGTFDAVLMRNELGFSQESRDLYGKAGLSLPESEDILEIVDISGDNRLGGDDIDTYAIEMFKTHYGLDISERELLQAAELTKISRVPQRVTLEGKDYSFDYRFVEDATMKVFTRCIGIVDKMLNRAGMKKVHCVLCGGSTKSEIIRAQLERRFECSTEIDPDIAVAAGDAMTARIISNKDSVSVIGRIAKHIGIIVDNKFTPVIRKGDIIPAHKQFSARNKTAFSESLDVDFYQTEDLFGDLTKIHTLRIDEVTGFNKQGFALIKVEVTVTLDGLIEVSAYNNGKEVRARLSADAISLDNGGDSDKKKESKLYLQLKSAIERNGIESLYPLLEKFKETEDRTIAREINDGIVKWRREHGE